MTLPPLPHHRLFTCHRHPSKPVTGFCAACLRERLAGIDPDTHQEAPVTHLATELRRCKSYSSSSKPNASSTSSSTTTTTTASEPRRKSCDIRSRNTLSDLFVIDDKRRGGGVRKSKALQLEIVFKEVEENKGEVRVSEEIFASNVSASERIVEDFEEDGELKTMKEFIDLELGRKKNGGRDFRDIAGSLWEAASVFSRKFGKWQLKQKKKKEESKDDKGSSSTEKRSVVKSRETQSEVGEYGFGRRSCDTDPRLSVDVAQLSIDDSRYSFDEPRASWDGCLAGKTLPRLTPLVSVAEDVNMPSSGAESPKENVNFKNEVESGPGGCAQTRDYYSAGRRSFDRSGSSRKLGLGDDELKLISNAMISPETVGLFHGAKLLVTEKELRDSNWYSLKDYHAENVDSLSKDVASVAGELSKKSFQFKKLQRWHGVWNIWGLMQRRSESKCDDGESQISGDVVDESVAECLPEIEGLVNGQSNGTVSQKLMCSYTVSARDSSKMSCSTGSIETRENDAKRREELALQRNRSFRYSSNNLDNGLLRFYLTPLRSYGRSKSVKNRLKNAHSMASNVL